MTLNNVLIGLCAGFVVAGTNSMSLGIAAALALTLLTTGTGEGGGQP